VLNKTVLIGIQENLTNGDVCICVHVLKSSLSHSTNNSQKCG